MSYGKRLEINFMSFSGIEFTFDIYKRDYTGAVDERDGCPPAVKIDWGDGANDSMPCLFGSKATVVFYSETQGEFSELYAADNRQFYGELVDNYGQRYWRGWIVPEQRNETLGYKSPVSLTFLDGIGELKNMDFLDGTGEAYTGRHSYLYFILEILNKLETGMNVSMQVDFRPEGLSASQCPFENMFVDATIYEGLKCSEVLEQLLAGCRLMQTFNQTTDSHWMVQSFASLQNYAKLTPGTTPTIEPVTFVSTPAGVVTLTGERPYIAINDDTLFHSDQPQFNNWSAWNYLDIVNIYSKIEDVLKNGSFENDLSDWTIYGDDLSVYLFSDMTKGLKIKGGVASSEITTPGYVHKAISQTVSGIKASDSGMRLKFSYNLFEGESGIGEGYLTINYGIFLTKTDGTILYGGLIWDATIEKTVIKFAPVAEDYGTWESGMWVNWKYYGIRVTQDMRPMGFEEERDMGRSKCVDTSHAESLTDYEIFIQSIPFDGSITVVFWNYQYANSNKYGDAYTDYNLIFDDVALEFIDDNYLDFPANSQIRIQNNIKCIENGDEFELLQGNVPIYDNRASIYRSYISSSISSGTFIDSFVTSNSLSVFPYYEMMARLLMSFHRRAPLSVDFVVDVDEWLMPPHYVVYDANSSTESFLAMVAFAFDFENSQASGNAVAILPFDEISTITYTEGEQASGSSKSRSSSDGVATHPAVKLADGCAAELTLVPETQVLNLDLSAYAKIEILHIANWDTAYGWGNHASAGYLKSYMETDPVFVASAAHGITSTNIANWNTAYGWGNHATAGYLKSYSETDPVFVASAAHGITSTNIANWDTAYGWGNHASAGYLKSYMETDPVFVASAAHGITSTNIANWNTAYGWGNHATAGYLTANSLTGYVPYTGATQDVDLGVYSIIAKSFGLNAGKNNPTLNRWVAIGPKAAFSSTTGLDWIAIGSNAGFSNTTGSGWVAIGINAGLNNTAGSNWTAISPYAGASNTTGSGWVAIGVLAANASINGLQFTAIGNRAGTNNTTGHYWTAIGASAGAYLTDGVTSATSFNNSTYIGSFTKVSANGAINENVIGSDAVGLGSNTFVLGNDNILKTILKGNVGIGIIAPNYKLDVVGAVNSTLGFYENGVKLTAGGAGISLSDIHANSPLTWNSSTGYMSATTGNITNGGTNLVTSGTIYSYLTSNYDKYSYWNLLVGGTLRANIYSTNNVNFVAGTNITLVYSSTNNTITINSTASSGGGISLTDIHANSPLSWDAGSGYMSVTTGSITNGGTNLVTSGTIYSYLTSNYDKYSNWNLYVGGTLRASIYSNNNVNFAAGTNVTLAYSSSNNTITINSTSSSGGGISLSDISATSPLSWNSSTGVMSVTTGSIANGGTNLVTSGTIYTYLSGNYDKYNYWNLYVGGTLRANITATSLVNFAAGTNVTLAYSAANNTVTINAAGASLGSGTYGEMLWSNNGTIDGADTVKYTGYGLRIGAGAILTSGSSLGYINAMDQNYYSASYGSASGTWINSVGSLWQNSSDSTLNVLQFVLPNYYTFIGFLKLTLHNTFTGGYNVALYSFKAINNGSSITFSYDIAFRYGTVHNIAFTASYSGDTFIITPTNFSSNTGQNCQIQCHIEGSVMNY